MAVRNQKGFTIVETIIYVAIIGVFMSTVILFGISAVQTAEKAVVAQEVQQNARFAMERVVREVRGAEALNIGLSTFANVSGVLALDVSTGGNTPTVFDLDAGRLRVTQGANPSVYLTTDDVEVTEFRVENRSVSGRTENVQIILTIQSAAGSGIVYNATTTLQSSAVIRKRER